jgi:hypothetical protein
LPSGGEHDALKSIYVCDPRKSFQTRVWKLIFKLMTKLLDQALEAVRRLPPDYQDEIARAMLSLAGDQGDPEPIDPAHLADVLESLAQAKRREFATDAEVEAAFRRFDQ